MQVTMGLADPIIVLKNFLILLVALEAVLTPTLLLGMGTLCALVDDSSIESCTLMGAVDRETPRYVMEGYNALHALLCMMGLMTLVIYHQAAGLGMTPFWRLLSRGERSSQRYSATTDLLFIALGSVGMCAGVVWVYGVERGFWYFVAVDMVYLPLNSILAAYLSKLDLHGAKLRRLFRYRSRRDQEEGGAGLTHPRYVMRDVTDSSSSSEGEDRDADSSAVHSRCTEWDPSDNVALRGPPSGDRMVGINQLAAYKVILRAVLKMVCYLMVLHNLCYLLYDMLEMSVLQLDPTLDRRDAKIGRVIWLVFLYYRICIARTVYEAC